LLFNLPTRTFGYWYWLSLNTKLYQMAVAENGFPGEAISSVQIRTNKLAYHSDLREPNLPLKPLNLPHPEYSTPRGVSPLISVPQAGIQYPNYTPFKLPDLVEHPFVDKAIGSDPQKTQLLSSATEVKHLTPAIGTELVGIQLKSLNNTQRNELARLVAERGVVFLRDQDLDVYEQIEFGAYFGELHIHQMAGIIPDLPWVHPIHKDETATNGRSHQIWHSDVSYEIQPPGLTVFRMDTLPKAGPDGYEAGGDTIWASRYGIYECKLANHGLELER
jgi:sulfonate dioxygenase